MSCEQKSETNKKDLGIVYDPKKVGIYNTYLQNTRAEENHVSVFYSKSKQGVEIPIILKMKDLTETTDEYRIHLDFLRSRHVYEWGCSMCKKRNRTLTGYVDSNFNPIVCRPQNVSRNFEQENIYELTETHIRNYIKETDVLNKGDWTYEVVKENTLFTNKLYEGGTKKHKFMHYSYVPDNYITGKMYNSSNYKTLRHGFRNYYIMYERALNKYAPLLFSMFNKCEMTPELVRSFELILDLLNKAVYGKQQIPAVEWFLRIFERITMCNASEWKQLNPKNKLQIVIHTIVESSITVGENKEAFLAHYHTINESILSLLEAGNSESGVIKMIEERNRPSNYMRKTAPPKAVHIERAKEFCSNIENTIMTTDELEEYPTCYKIFNNSENSARDAFAIMENDLKHKNKYSSFASRIGGSKPIKPNSIRELIELVKKGDITKLESRPHGSAYLAKTTLLPEDLAYPEVGHLWLYIEKDEARWGGINSWNEITHVYEVNAGTRHNIHFIIKDSRDTLKARPIANNCTLPEFLAPKHHSAKSAFEKLRTLTNVKIPNKGDIAFGLGTSVADSYNNLVRKITFRINGKHTVVISKG